VGEASEVSVLKVGTEIKWSSISKLRFWLKTKQDSEDILPLENELQIISILLKIVTSPVEQDFQVGFCDHWVTSRTQIAGAKERDKYRLKADHCLLSCLWLLSVLYMFSLCWVWLP